MDKFYITFGSEAHPYPGGWAVVYAADASEADAIVRKRYGLDKNGAARYCGCYSEDRFNKTSMATAGNHGLFCQETIGGPNE